MKFIGLILYSVLSRVINFLGVTMFLSGIKNIIMLSKKGVMNNSRKISYLLTLIIPMIFLFSFYSITKKYFFIYRVSYTITLIGALLYGFLGFLFG